MCIVFVFSVVTSKKTIVFLVLVQNKTDQIDLIEF